MYRHTSSKASFGCSGSASGAFLKCRSVLGDLEGTTGPTKDLEIHAVATSRGHSAANLRPCGLTMAGDPANDFSMGGLGWSQGAKEPSMSVWSFQDMLLTPCFFWMEDLGVLVHFCLKGYRDISKSRDLLSEFPCRESTSTLFPHAPSPQWSTALPQAVSRLRNNQPSSTEVQETSSWIHLSPLKQPVVIRLAMG